jgi:hypothetical protein
MIATSYRVVSAASVRRPLFRDYFGKLALRHVAQNSAFLRFSTAKIGKEDNFRIH